MYVYFAIAIFMLLGCSLVGVGVALVIAPELILGAIDFSGAIPSTGIYGMIMTLLMMINSKRQKINI